MQSLLSPQAQPTERDTAPGAPTAANETEWAHPVELGPWKAELLNLRAQQVVLDSFVTSVTRSWWWKCLGPYRALRHLVAPRGFDATALLPWNDLEPGAGPGAWKSLGFDPQFLAPCVLAAGWVRIRCRMTSAVPIFLEVFVDTGQGFNAKEIVARRATGTELDWDCFVYLPRPVRAFRIDPLNSEGTFSLESFSVQPLSGPRVLAHALRAKLHLLVKYRRTRAALANGLRLLLRGKVVTFAQKLTNALKGPAFQGLGDEAEREAYDRWRQRHALTDADRERMRRAGAALADPPRISVLMPVYNVEERYLRQALDSVLRQTYPHWELCVADDASSAAHVRPLLEEYARRDPRVRVAFRTQRGNIAAATNSALGLATGPYVAMLDHDDELAEHALFRVAQTIAAGGQPDMIYSDEDKLDEEGRHVEPFFKPDWSPEYLQACMYTCHLSVFRTALVRELGGFRSDFDSAQDYDLALRIAARSDRVEHIPDVLYHWRKLPTSTASGDQAKPQAHATARRALAGYLEAIGRKGTVEPGPTPGFHRVRFALVGRPKVSIVIPTAAKPVRRAGRDTTYLAVCLESIRRNSTYPNYDLHVVHNDDLDPSLRRQLEQWDVRLVPFREPFNLAEKMNQGAAAADGEHLLFLNDDVEVVTPDWLECLLEFAQQPQIGAVGAKLFFPSGRLQHVGVTILAGNPGHPFYGFPGEHLGYFCGNVVTRNYSAVTGACMMTRADVFRSVGGFSPEFPLNYNDVDYCLKVVRSGRRIVFTPYARLVHHEAVSKDGVHPRELAAFKERWGAAWARDPYYNPHLTTGYCDFRIEGGFEGPGLERTNQP